MDSQTWEQFGGHPVHILVSVAQRFFLRSVNNGFTGLLFVCPGIQGCYIFAF